MPASYANIQRRLKAFDFKGLFTQELMWNNYPSRELSIPMDATTYVLTPVAEQRGMAVYVCVPPTGVPLPNYATRRKIDTQVTKSSREHIVIFHDAAKTTQIWQWVKRESGKPSACREQIFYSNQTGDALIQKIQGIAFGLEEVDSLSIVDVTNRVGTVFDVEKVTKKFYELFKKEHDGFQKFVRGIPDEELQAWYVSVMLNRLMFIYFIQKKSFLNNDLDYLHSKLMESKRRGKDNFYKDFLCPLFFEGFAKHERSLKTTQLLGNIPYLNGGLFLKHQIEELYGEAIKIPDGAFEKIFHFFEEYDWQLDDRPTRKGNEVNPDVLGYVFEKYINQKEMGAYYSKEDITGYIGKNTIIPAIFSIVRTAYMGAFEDENAIWRLLKADPDRYIHASILHGADKHLPLEIVAGIADIAARCEWNKPAPPAYALPAETWREVVARRDHCDELRRKLAAGEIASINDLIICNLDITRFAEEVIANCEQPELLWAFRNAIWKVSILDPACGSGAFLFAALNILERLYDTCLVRMQGFVDDLERSGTKHSPKIFRDFGKILEEMNDKTRHPSPRYFVLKTIILSNLYGVDVMEEATEICRLRLFLKLVSQVNPGERIEPLPDIDFNIRAGNSLVGFATESELDLFFGSKLDFDNKKKDITERAEQAELAFDRFRDMQVKQGTVPEDLVIAKKELQTRLSALRSELDGYLASLYGVKSGNDSTFDQWRRSHHPFHWFVEFFGIMQAGGFDAVIGNPPYIEYNKVMNFYTLLSSFEPYATNLYAAFGYRCCLIKSKTGYASLIVPVSLPSTDRMRPLRQLLSEGHTVCFTGFSTRPAKLFDGAEQRLVIYIQIPTGSPILYSGGYLKWYSTERPHLFQTIEYVPVESLTERHAIWLKVRGRKELEIFARLRQARRLGESGVLGKGQVLYYKNTGLRYFNTVTLDAPRCWINGKKSASSRETQLEVNPKFKNAVHAYLISSVFFFYWQATSNGRDLNPSDIALAPYPDLSAALQDLNKLSTEAEEDYRAKGKILRMKNKKTGVVEIESLTPANSKHVLDKIDKLLGSVLHFEDDLTDYIVNYDIKYRMGADALKPDRNDDE